MPQLLINTAEEITVCLCRTELETMLKQMNEFPDQPNWWAGRKGDIWLKVTAIDNTGVE